MSVAASCTAPAVASCTESARRSDVGMVKAHPGTWGAEVQGYEFAKRKAVHPDSMKGPPIRVTYGLVKQQERLFDPIVQCYRRPETEIHSRTREEEARTHHLNRAYDIQLLREQPYNLITNSSKLEGLAPGVDVSKFDTTLKRGRPKLPDTFVDYNILSNYPMSKHHWARPEERPMPTVKEPRSRLIPTFLVKDFNIITNRYLEHHDEKRRRDDELNLLECTAKYRTRNRFDPLGQEYIDPDEENRMKIWQEAREVELVEQAQKKVPPSQKNRATAFYNPVNNDVCDGDMLKWMDLAEEERKERFKNKYVMEHNWHAQDIKGDHINNERKLNKVSFERYKYPAQRGYCIVSHRRYDGRHSFDPYDCYARPNYSVWERVCHGTHEAEKSRAVPTVQESSEKAAEKPASVASQEPRPEKSSSPVKSPGGSPAKSHSVASHKPRSSPTRDTTAPSVAAATVHSSEHSRSSTRLPAVRHPVPAGVPKISMPHISAPPAPSLAGSDGGSVYSKPVAVN